MLNMFEYVCLIRCSYLYYDLLEVKFPYEPVCRLVSLAVGWAFLKGREVSLPCSWRSIVDNLLFYKTRKKQVYSTTRWKQEKALYIVIQLYPKALFQFKYQME